MRPARHRTMIICICRRISDRELAQHARGGKDFDDIQFDTGVSSQCGQCESAARDVVARHCSTAQQQLCNLRKAEGLAA